MSSPWLLVVVTAGHFLVAGVLAAQASKAIAAARARAGRRSDCPFEDDDDLPRPWVREVRDVLIDSATLLRLACTVAPRAWRIPVPRPGHGPIAVLVPARGLRSSSLATLGHRLARDLDASIHLAPPRAAAGGPDAVERLRDLVEALAAAEPTRPLVLIGHGGGGRTAVATAERSRVVSTVVTLATDHRPERDRPARGHAVLSIYSLHDAHIVPPTGAYLADAVNVALRDVGHYEMAVSRRAHQVVRELLEPAEDDQVADGIAS